MDSLKDKILSVLIAGSDDELFELLADLHQISLNPKNHNADSESHPAVGVAPNDESAQN